MKQKDSKYKNSFLGGQIDSKNMKEKSKLLVKCFVNTFRKNPRLTARTVPNQPEMSLFEPRKKSKKRIAISKVALQQVELTAKIARRRWNYSQHELLTLQLIWQVNQKKTSNNSLEMCQNCLKSHCLNQKKSQQKG